MRRIRDGAEGGRPCTDGGPAGTSTGGGPVGTSTVDRQQPRSARGRRRDAALDARILDGLIPLLGAHGYSGMTLDMLAERSGVAKTTILRRWPSKAAVVAAAVERLSLSSVDLPDSGSLRSDLRALLDAAVATFVRGRGRFVPGLFGESGRHPELHGLLRTVIDTRRQAYRRIVARAIRRGELPPSVDQELLIDLLIAPLWTRLVITGEGTTDEYVRANVEAVLSAFGAGEPSPG